MADSADNIKITLAYLREKFNEFNELIFNGDLPVPHLRIGSSRTMLGNVRYKRIPQLRGRDKYTDFTLTISSYYSLPADVMEDTIIHEMIHYYILYFQIKDTSAHGVEFRRMMDDTNARFGRHITISYRNYGEMQMEQKPTKQYIVGVSVLPDGSLGVTIPCTGRMHQMNKDLPRYFNIEGLRWYNSRDPFFANIPKSRTPKIYKVDQEKLIIALKNAIPLC